MKSWPPAGEILERHKQANEQALLEAYAEGVKAGQSLAQAEIESLRESNERLMKQMLDMMDEIKNPRTNF